jgi:hypothetical protein
MPDAPQQILAVHERGRSGTIGSRAIRAERTSQKRSSGLGPSDTMPRPETALSGFSVDFRKAEASSYWPDAVYMPVSLSCINN